MTSNRYTSTRTRQGATLVEFAVTLPIVLLFFAFMTEISRVMMLQHTADTAAYEGARSIIVPGASPLDGYTAADELLKAAEIRSAGITVSPDSISETTPIVTVSVEIPISDNSWIYPRWIPISTVRSDVTLFCERPPLVQLTGVPIIKAKKAAIKKALSGL
ncbi:MAG: TadE family protein [Pirellulales bacterium]